MYFAGVIIIKWDPWFFWGRGWNLMQIVAGDFEGFEWALAWKWSDLEGLGYLMSMNKIGNDLELPPGFPRFSKQLDINITKTTCLGMWWVCWLLGNILGVAIQYSSSWWFQIFLCSSLPLETIQFDSYFSNGLVQPPTSHAHFDYLLFWFLSTVFMQRLKKDLSNLNSFRNGVFSSPSQEALS